MARIIISSSVLLFVFVFIAFVSSTDDIFNDYDQLSTSTPESTTDQGTDTDTIVIGGAETAQTDYSETLDTAHDTELNTSTDTNKAGVGAPPYYPKEPLKCGRPSRYVPRNSGDLSKSGNFLRIKRQNYRRINNGFLPDYFEGSAPIKNVGPPGEQVVTASPLAETMDESNEGEGEGEGEGLVNDLFVEDGASRIVGGYPVSIEEWPWQVSLRVQDTIHICGGTVINQRFFITAAHCFQQLRNPGDFTVYLGKSLKRAGESGEIVRRVEKIFLHARHNQGGHNNNDIALVKLSQAVPFSSRVAPICFPRRSAEIPLAARCFVSGYGETKNSGGENALKMARVDYINARQCKALGANYNRSLTENMICAGILIGGTDSCQGDSGGPLVCEDVVNSKGVFTLYGIVSYGWGCALPNKPGVYTKVANYLPWILRNLKL